MAKSKIELQMFTNAKQMLGELQQINGSINAINYSVQDMNRKGVAGAIKHSSAIKNLALRFVGYNLILNQVMGAQQKVVDYIKESITKFREFETRLAEVSTIMTGDFEPALQSMKSGIVNLALTTGQATSDLTKGLYDIMSAAFDAKDSINLLNTATKASIAGLSDVRTSVDIFTTVLNTYGMSVYEATKVSDTLFQSVVRGKFQFADLESALGYVVPIAAQAGIEFEELMAALSTATRHGLHLDMASRGLAMALQNIINPSEGAAKAARKYGVEMSGLALRIKGITGVFSDMQEKTKQYGKIVLNELIPNIRSLRVAMVLAGEEGMEGLLDDMEKLQVSAERTEEAFNRIKNTSQFASNVITQDWEKTQREVGAAWDELALGIQKGITDIVANWKSFIPIIGPIFTAEKWDKYQDKLKRVTALEEKYLGIKRGGKYGAKYTLIEQSDVDIMKSYLAIQKEMGNLGEQITIRIRRGEEYDDLKEQLLECTTISQQLTDNFNRAFGESILGGIRNLESLKLTLEEIEFDIERLREHLEKPIKFGWGGFQERFEARKEIEGGIKGTLNYQMQLLLADQELADVTHDISSGLADQNYQFKVLNKKQQEAVRIVREHEAATKSARQETTLMNIELRKLQIQMLELQLVGMIRRRGLTRAEEKKMKALQIAQAKLRLKNLKETEKTTKEMYTNYLEKKALLDNYVRDLQESQYQLKYSYDQQVADLNNTINYERNLLKEREIQWDNTINKITTKEQELSDTLKKILEDKDLTSAFDFINIDIQELRDNVIELIDDIDELTQKVWGKKKKSSTPPTIEEIPEPLRETTLAKTGLGRIIAGQFFQRGAEYVHETGMAMVHKGEAIVPAGKKTGGDIIIEHVTIEVDQISDIDDVEKIGAVLSSAANSYILDKKGKTRYRLR